MRSLAELTAAARAGLPGPDATTMSFEERLDLARDRRAAALAKRTRFSTFSSRMIWLVIAISLIATFMGRADLAFALGTVAQGIRVPTIIARRLGRMGGTRPSRGRVLFSVGLTVFLGGMSVAPIVALPAGILAALPFVWAHVHSLARTSQRAAHSDGAAALDDWAAFGRLDGASARLRAWLAG